MDANNHWHSDKGRPTYTEYPVIVDTPKGKKDISEWAKRQVTFNYWLALRASDGREWNARPFVDPDILVTLEHGKYYTPQELHLSWLLLARKDEKMPQKLQFIVERLY